MERTKNLLIVNSCFPIELKDASLVVKDGLSSYSVGIAEQLKDRYSVTIVSPGRASSFSYAGIKFINWGDQSSSSTKIGNMDHWLNTFRYVLANDFDIIIVHSAVTVFSSPVADVFRAQCIGIIHDTHSGKNSVLFNLWRDIWLRYSKKLDLVLSDNDYGRQRLIETYKYDPQKVHCTGSGVDLDRFSFSSVKEDRLLFIGRFVRSKNVAELVQGFKGLLRENKNVKLVLIGNGVLNDKLVEDVSENGLHDQVEILSNLNDEQKIAELKRAKIYVSLSQVEGFGISLVEGMACGAVPVVSDIPAHRFVFQGRKVGFLVKDAGELAARASFLLKNEAVRGEMARAGRTLVEEVWNWKKVQERYERAMSQLPEKRLSPFSQKIKKPVKIGILKLIVSLFYLLVIETSFYKARNDGE